MREVCKKTIGIMLVIIVIMSLWANHCNGNDPLSFGIFKQFLFRFCFGEVYGLEVSAHTFITHWFGGRISGYITLFVILIILQVFWGVIEAAFKNLFRFASSTVSTLISKVGIELPTDILKGLGKSIWAFITSTFSMAEKTYEHNLKNNSLKNEESSWIDKLNNFIKKKTKL